MENDPFSLNKLTFSLLLLFCSSFVFANNINSSTNLERQVDHLINLVDDGVKDRLQQLDQSLLEHRFDESVRKLIEYHIRYPRQTAINVGRAIAFFPIFEEELAVAGLPESLKYLPVIESSLRPWVSSRVGAVGLWQFMPETAPEFGLRINDFVDERMDVRKSTQAAIRYLTSAHEYLEDWSLAIAAYNAGKGRVNRAKRRSGGNNFWSVRRHLPRETRNYVPAFIAAIYLTEFYSQHDVDVEMPGFDEQLITSVEVHYPLSFYQLAQLTGLSIDVIERLNPCYVKGFLPASKNDSYHVLIPKRVEPALRGYLNNWASDDDEPFLPWTKPLQLAVYAPNDYEYYQKYSWLVAENDSLENISIYTGIPASQLAIWNRLSPLDSLMTDQYVNYYGPVVYKHLPVRDKTILAKLSNQNDYFQINQQHKKPHKLPVEFANTFYFSVKEKTKPSNIARKFYPVSLEELLQMNKLKNDRMLPAGAVMKIPKN